MASSFTIENPEISIVLPTYNESLNIAELLKRIDATLTGHAHFEVIVADDNSPDFTWKLAEELARTRPWLHVIRRLHDRGLSAAVIEGFGLSRGKFKIAMDADLQHDETALLPMLLKFREGAHIVVASRRAIGGGISNWSWARRKISSLATRIAQALLPLPSTDPMSGFFGVSQLIHEQLTPKINPRGFKILIEYLARAGSFKVEEVGYTFQPRLHGESKLSPDVVLEYLEAIWELSRFGSLLPWKFLNYALVGLIGLLINVVSLALFRSIFSLSDSNALWWAIECAILSNFTLNNSITFRKNRFRQTLPLIRGLATFHAVSWAGAYINHSLAISLHDLHQWPLGIATSAGYLVSLIWNYSINVQICWKTR